MRKAVLFFCVVSATAVVASAQAPSDLETTIINVLRGSSEASAQLDPAVGDNTTNMVVVATPDGITASTYFTR